jgi:anti-anti-sigma factor
MEELVHSAIFWDGGVPIMVVSGEIDLSNASEFEKRLSSAAGDGRAGLVVLLKEVSFCDTSGLRALVNTHRSLPDGRRLHVVLPKDGIRKVFKITALDQFFACFDDLAAALDSARGLGGDGWAGDGPPTFAAGNSHSLAGVVQPAFHYTYGAGSATRTNRT